jgi:hypothetical protein
MVLDLATRSVTLRHVEYDPAAPFVATRETGLAPRLGLATLANKLRSFVEI